MMTLRHTVLGLPLMLTLLIAQGGALSGCASAPDTPASFAVIDEQYPRVFDAARTELTLLGFDLERIDAQAGVIETRPKQTAGLATPWDTEQSTFRQEWEDLTNDQRRVVRVTFDQTQSGKEARVEVTLYRLRVPGQRIETEAIRLSSRSIDEQARQSGQSGLFLTPIGRDTKLESRIAQLIETRLAE